MTLQCKHLFREKDQVEDENVRERIFVFFNVLRYKESTWTVFFFVETLNKVRRSVCRS